MQHDADPPPATNIAWTSIPVDSSIEYGQSSVKLSAALHSLSVGVTISTAPSSGTAYSSLIITGKTANTGGSDKSFIITPRLVGNDIKLYLVETASVDSFSKPPKYYACLVKKT